MLLFHEAFDVLMLYKILVSCCRDGQSGVNSGWRRSLTHRPRLNGLSSPFSSRSFYAEFHSGYVLLFPTVAGANRQQRSEAEAVHMPVSGKCAAKHVHKRTF